ncbi:Zinc finger, SWIM-type [Heracleum sosnowskyi]|uniref:Zinc finger, SWIM-type n=1 Tax=Heracleum sosnowskyi TaxID=360622 RepID=A0AAD8IPI4_9APIA|nr:Zinc finger, SWIM-type [Heracleum sosnowskyi]
MATGAAADGFCRSLYNNGCIPGNDTGIQRRPYHRNCSCALHNTRGYCGHVSQNTKISYPIRRASSESCLTLIEGRSVNSNLIVCMAKKICDVDEALLTCMASDN